VAAKPVQTEQVPASSSPFPGVQAAAKRSPNATGSYSSEWTSPTASTSVDEILASLLPTTATATSVTAAANTTYLTPKALSSGGYTRKSAAALAGIPAARTAVFTSTTAGAYPLAVVVFRVDRVVVVVFAQRKATAVVTSSAAASLAVAEYHQLEKVAPGFSLLKTTHPRVASIVFAVASVAVALAAAGLVVTFGWWRRRRAAKEAARIEALRLARDRDRRKRAARQSD
jgi:hypothetical protein